VKLTDPSTSIPTQIILQKYLNANDGDVTKAKDQLTKTLEWRAKMKPLEMIKGKYSEIKFGGLGYVTVYEPEGEKSAEPESKEIFTW
jgi:phosphatidylinositol transfer protein SFH5